MAFASAPGAGRPHYGGTLRLEMQAAVRTLDPADWPADPLEAAGRGALTPVVFETLLTLDDAGRLRPSLGLEWQTDATMQRWHIRLRPNVRLHDGTLLTPTLAAAALSRLSTGWTVQPSAEGIAIDTHGEVHDLPWELASPRRALAVALSGETPVGTGPFAVDHWEAARRGILRANTTHWAGRPFLDAVHIVFGRPLPDQLADLELGRADVASLLPQDVRRSIQRGLRVQSAPNAANLFVLVIERGTPWAGSDTARQALAAGLDRAGMANIVLQRQAVAALSLLPDWLTGYASLLGRDGGGQGRGSRDVPGRDREAARKLTSGLAPALRTVSLSFPATDALARQLAERLAVDARDIGLTVRLNAPGRPDVRLARVRLEPASPERAFAGLVTALRLAPSPPAGDRAASGAGSGIEAVFEAEQALLGGRLAIPLVNVTDLVAVSPRVQTWNGRLLLPSGAWNLGQTWLRVEVP